MAYDKMLQCGLSWLETVVLRVESPKEGKEGGLSYKGSLELLACEILKGRIIFGESNAPCVHHGHGKESSSMLVGLNLTEYIGTFGLKNAS